MKTATAINSTPKNMSATSLQCSDTSRHSAALFSRMALATSQEMQEEEGEECQPQHTSSTTTAGAGNNNKDDDSSNSSDGSNSCSSGWSASTPSFDDGDLDLPETYKNLIQENKHRNHCRKFHECYCKEKRLQNGAFGIVYEASRIVPIAPEVEIVPVKIPGLEGEGGGSAPQEEEKKEQDTGDDTASTTSITATPTTQATKFAVKQIDRTKLKTKRDDTAVFREVCILRELVDVPNVITLVDFFVEPKTLYVVLTLAAGGDVFDRLIQRKTYTEQFARELAKILLRTLSMIHDRKIVHRDLKPGNLLLATDSDDCSILLADFGFATKLNADGYCRTRCGTPMYVAPEVILDVPYTQKVDMWSCGCILYLLLCGYPPFRGEHHRDLFRRVRAGNFTFHEATWGNVSIPAKQLIAKLLTVNPKHRWTAQQALEEASWFKAKTTDPLHLSENDLSEALTRIRSRRKLKAAMDAVRWAATARFWNPEKVTFAQTVKKWDRSLSANSRTATTETDPQQPQSARSLSSTPTTTPPSGNSEGTNSSIGSTTSSGAGATAGVITTMPPPPAKPVKFAHFDERYMLLRKVRKGAYATVWECRRKDGAKKLQTFAVKIIPRPCLSLDHDEQVLNEVSILQSVSVEAPECIVDLVDFYEEEDAFYIVMELMTGGDVFDRVTQRSCYSERDARDLIKRLLEAVDNLHKKGIAHRDIKPQNLLLHSKSNDSHIKLCDFGFARRVHTPQSLTHRVGTPPYVAPEILKNIPHDERVDLWSVGVVSFVLLVGYPPFAHESRELVCNQIKGGAWSFYEPDWRHISPDAKELILGLMQVDPVERLSASEALQCKWIRQSDDRLSSRNLNASLSQLKSRRHDLRVSAHKTFQWFNLLNHGFASKPISSPTQANQSLMVEEDSIGNFEVSK